MDEMTTMYQRIRTLALQSSNGTNSTKDRASLQEEVNQLCSEIDRIASDTTFGGQKILNGDTGVTFGQDLAATGTKKDDKLIKFQVGADAKQTIDTNLAGTAGEGFNM